MNVSFDALRIASLKLPPRNTWPAQAEVRQHYGQAFLWHAYENGGRNLTPDQLEPYRMAGDEEMDEILEALAQSGAPLRAGDDLLAIIQQAKKAAEPRTQLIQKLLAFDEKYRTIPDWVDSEQIRRGQQVSVQYMPALKYSLYYRSLVPGFSIPEIAAVIVATGYMGPTSSKERIWDRLEDTNALLTASSLDDEKGLGPDSAGWTAAIRVRVLHAKVRRALKKQRRWNVEKWGVPLNQADMAATLVAFSLNALLGAELLLGFPLPLQERLDYMALWRYLGWILGCDVVAPDEEGPAASTTVERPLRPLDVCGPGWIKSKPDVLDHAWSYFCSYGVHLIHPNDLSVQISHHLLGVGIPPPGSDRIGKRKEHESSMDDMDYMFYYRCQQCRIFVGTPLADALQLPDHPVWIKRLRTRSFGVLVRWILRVYTMASLPWSPLRSRIYGLHARFDVFSWKRWEDTKQTGASQSDCPFAMVAHPHVGTTD